MAAITNKVALISIGTIVLMALLLVSCSQTTMKTATKNRIAQFETSKGTFTLELFTEQMPVTTENFIKLAQAGFYDSQRFHRVIAGFMIQAGDPQSKQPELQWRWGTGGPGYTIKDEFSPGLRNVRGTMAMANAGPDTGGSQFFINVADNTFLDGKHPVFGKVIKGMEVMEAISNAATDSDDRPREEVVITRIIISSG